jgi:hypothetical protein
MNARGGEQEDLFITHHQLRAGHPFHPGEQRDPGPLDDPPLVETEAETCMSYVYLLFKPLGPGPMSTWPAVQPEPLGTAEDLKARLAAIFPDVTWRPWAHGAWFGQTTPADPNACQELQLTPDENGQYRFVTARRTTREQLARLCRALDLVAFDPQQNELIRPDDDHSTK